MAFLTRRKPWDELLPNGQSVYDAVRILSRRPIDAETERPLETTIPPLINTPLMRRPVPIETAQTSEGAFEPLSRLPAVTPTAAPQPDFAPSVLTRAQPALSEIGPPPVMLLDRGGHAVSATGGADPLEADQTLLRAQQSEIPERESKKMMALRALEGFLFGGAPGAAQTVLSDLSDRRALDRGRIDRNIARTQGQINQGILNRRSGLQEDLLRSQVGENQAQAERARREPLTREPGFTLNEGGARYDARGNVIATRPGKPTVEKPPERSVVNGVLVERQKDGSWKPVYESPEKPDAAGFTNEQITRNIQDAAAEQGKVEQALRDTAPTISKPSLYAGEPPTVERNPIYADLENRRDKLIDFQRTERGKLKPVTARRGSGAIRPARDGKYHYTSDQIRTAAESSGKSYDEVLRQLSARPNVIIDQ